MTRVGCRRRATAGAAFFKGFARVVLVANSDAVDIAALSARYGDGTLFVFFNKVFKVLDAPFERPSLLIARSSQAGANIVYRGEVGTVLRLLRGRAVSWHRQSEGRPIRRSSAPRRCLRGGPSRLPRPRPGIRRLLSRDPCPDERLRAGRLAGRGLPGTAHRAGRLHRPPLDALEAVPRP